MVKRLVRRRLPQIVGAEVLPDLRLRNRPPDYARRMTLTDPPPLHPLHGSERFTGLDGVVQDFWRFALPSLVTNNTRGWFAEYLVWRALGIDRPIRIEWDAFDVLWNGLRIEVKASAHVQGWAQKRPSELKFSRLRGKLLDEDTNTYSDQPTYNADIYVFAVQQAPDHDAYQQLDVTQWRFAVVTRTAIAATGYAAVSWRTAQKIADQIVDYEALAAAIAASGEAEMRTRA